MGIIVLNVFLAFFVLEALAVVLDEIFEIRRFFLEWKPFAFMFLFAMVLFFGQSLITTVVFASAFAAYCLGYGIFIGVKFSESFWLGCLTAVVMTLIVGFATIFLGWEFAIPKYAEERSYAASY